MKFQYYFIIIVIFKIIHSEFQLPFKVKHSLNCFIKDYCKDYYIDISLGNPPQNLLLKIFLEKYSFYIINSNQNYENIIQFKESESKTIVTHEEEVCIIFDEVDYAYLAEDDFIINNKKISNMTFISADIVSIVDDYKGYTGPLGLGNVRSEESNAQNLIKSLKKKDIINSYDYSFTFNEDGNSGIIHIGERPDQYDSKHYSYDNYNITMIIGGSNVNYWEIAVDKFEIFGKKVDFDISECSLKISLESNFITAFTELNTTIYNNFFSQYISKNICEIIRDNSIYYYVCDKSFSSFKKNFGEIKIGNSNLNKTFIFDYKDLFLETKDKIYFLIRIKSFSYKKTIIVGDILLKKYLVVFNQDKKSIGIYNGNNSPNGKQFSSILVFILFLIFLIICVIVIIFLSKNLIKLKKYITKKRAIEFQDEYEYIRKE